MKVCASIILWVLLAFSLLIKESRLFAQSYSVTIYDTEKGLPSELTKCITKDELGFVWIGTDDGMARFDGNAFRSFRKELSSPLIKSFFHTKDGRMLVVNDMGIDEIKSLSDTTFITPYIKGGQTASDSTLFYPKSLFQTSDGALWVSENAQIVKCKGNKIIKRYPFQKEDITSSFTRSFQLFEDEKGTFWVISNPGRLFYYSTTLDQFVHVPWSKPFKSVTSLLYQGNNKLWVGSYDGLFEVTLQEKQALVKNLISDLAITYIAQNASGQTMLGTRNMGLFKFEMKNGKPMPQAVPEIAEGNVNSIMYDPSASGWWICTQEGFLLIQMHFFTPIELEGKKVHVHGIAATADNIVYIAEGRGVYAMRQTEAGWHSSKVWDFDGHYVMTLAAQGEYLWLGMSSGVLYKLHPITKVLKEVHFGNEEDYNAFISNIFIDRQGHIWVSKRNTRGIYKITEHTGKEGEIGPYRVDYYGESRGIATEITVVEQSARGYIYAAGSGNKSYLFRYDPESETFINVSRPVSIECSSKFEVEDMVVAGDSAIWLASTCGVWFYNLDRPMLPDRVSFQRFSADLGVPNIGDHVKALFIDRLGRFWMAAKTGITYYDQVHLLSFEEASGLPAKTLHPRTFFVDAQNRLWLGTVKGASVVNLDSFSTKETPAPLLLEIFKNTERISSYLQEPVLSSENYLKFSYSSLVFPGGHVQYQTRIIGLDSNWSVPSSKTETLIPRLKPGYYEFQVRAHHLNGYHWSQPASFGFHVEIPWYSRWWAIFLYAIAAYLGIAGIVRLNTWRLRNAKKQLAQAVRERMAESIEQNKLLNQQKEEIERQRDFISERNRALEQAQQTIEEQNGKLIASNYILEEEVEARTKALNDALAELKKSHAELDNFIYRAAHDLRGPIARIMGLVNLLAYQPVDDFTRDCINRLRFTSESMSILLKRLSRIREIKAENPQWVRVQLSQLIQREIENFSQKGLVLPGQILAEVDHKFMFYTDPVLMREMLQHLIQNCIDFQKQDTPLQASVQVKAEGSMLSIIISDNGMGILEEEAQKRAFEIFYVGSQASRGPGLGLYESMLIADKLKGRIQLLHTSEEGTQMLVVLPIFNKYTVPATPPKNEVKV